MASEVRGGGSFWADRFRRTDEYLLSATRGQLRSAASFFIGRNPDCKASVDELASISLHRRQATVKRPEREFAGRD